MLRSVLVPERRMRHAHLCRHGFLTIDNIADVHLSALIPNDQAPMDLLVKLSVDLWVPQILPHLGEQHADFLRFPSQELREQSQRKCLQAIFNLY